MDVAQIANDTVNSGFGETAIAAVAASVAHTGVVVWGKVKTAVVAYIAKSPTKIDDKIAAVFTATLWPKLKAELLADIAKELEAQKAEPAKAAAPAQA